MHSCTHVTILRDGADDESVLSLVLSSALTEANAKYAPTRQAVKETSQR